jgi:hypothetical protein
MMHFDDDEPQGAALLLEAAQIAANWHGREDDEQVALVAKARAKVPGGERGAGGELIQNTEPSTYLLNTLDHPDFVAADASDQRMQLVKKAGALALGVDAADTIQAANSIELMLAHQLAATHAATMRLMGQLSTIMDYRSNAVAEDDSANVRATRLAGAASRLMTAYQQGVVALDRIRTGGKQTIIVQHVEVSEGGQAVVAGAMKGPCTRGGGRNEFPRRAVSKNTGRNSGGRGRR